MGYVYPPQTIDLLSGCACAIIFIILLSLDAWKAIKRKMYWLPGGFLVLSALTLQFINYVDYSAVSVSSGTEDITDEDVKGFLSIQLVIDSGRLVICVFIAYLLPGLVSSRFISVWGDIGALALGVLANIFAEIYLVYVYNHLPNSHELWFKVSSAILSTAITLLVLLSICAVLAGKGIRIIRNKKVPSLLSCCSNSRRGCENIGDHVLKCWIVVRSSQPQYIMARSVLSSFAGLLVTICVAAIVVKWIWVYNDDYKKLLPLYKTTFLLQLIFALIGWIVVSVRWFTAVIYFPRYGHSLFQVEDFWTRSIIDLKYGQLKGPLFREKRHRKRFRLETNILYLIIAVRLHSLLLPICILLQKLIVLLSKASLFLSWIIFLPLRMSRAKISLRSCSKIPTSEFSKYGKFLVSMPGEIAERLWIANESAFISAKKHMQQGMGSTAKLIEMRRRRTETNQEEEMYLKYAGKKSWKMKSVSLIHFMLCYYDDSRVDDAIKDFSEAWAAMDFVESSDTEANLASLAADKEFDTLQNISNKRLKMKHTQSKPVRTIRDRMIEDTESRIRNGENQESEDTEQDSMDWITAAPDFSLYKTREVINSKEIDLESANAIDSLRSLMANVIANCLENELNNALIEKCNEWALGGKEQEIYHAAFIAGKATSVSDLFQTSEGNGAVPKAVAEDNGAVPEAVAEGNGAVPEAWTSEGNGAVPEAVAEDNGAVPEAVAEGNGNDASEGEADGEHNESSDSEIEEESEESNC